MLPSCDGGRSESCTGRAASSECYSRPDLMAGMPGRTRAFELELKFAAYGVGQRQHGPLGTAGCRDTPPGTSSGVSGRTHQRPLSGLSQTTPVVTVPEGTRSARWPAVDRERGGGGFEPHGAPRGQRRTSVFVISARPAFPARADGVPARGWREPTPLPGHGDLRSALQTRRLSRVRAQTGEDLPGRRLSRRVRTPGRRSESRSTEGGGRRAGE